MAFFLSLANYKSIFFGNAFNSNKAMMGDAKDDNAVRKAESFC